MFQVLRVFFLALVSIVTTTGCSVETPAYNPVLGGFPMLRSSIGDVARNTHKTSDESRDMSRAQPKSELISIR
jgi:hypothetical protein